MLKHHSNHFAIWLFAGDMLLTLMALEASRRLRQVLPIGWQIDPLTGQPIRFEIDWTFFIIVLGVWAIVFLTLPVYNGKRSLHVIGDVQITLIAIAFAVLILAGMAYLFFREFSRAWFLYFTLIDAALLILWRGILRAFQRIQHSTWPSSKRRVLIVGTGYIADELADRIQNYAWTGLELVGFLSDLGTSSIGQRSILGKLADVKRIVTELHIDEILIALPLRAHQEMANLIVDLQHLPVSIRVVPDLFDLAFTRTGIDDLDGIPIVSLRDPAMTPLQRAVKRIFDLIGATLLLIVFAVPMLIIAILIKRDSPGPSVFRQQRAGENGRLFWMLKFRTMVENAEAQLERVAQTQADGQIIFKRPDDPRLTRTGRWLRRFSLDELPQLFNVLKGEMSLVGPRPELPRLVERYVDWQFKRFNVPQGMTGWWQVNGRSEKPTLAKTRDDLFYIQNYSLLLDIVILWKTIGAVFRRRGAF